MGFMPVRLPSLKLVVLIVLATVLILNTSTANGTLCSSLHCVDVSSPACKFCNRRVGKRTENYAWRDDRDTNKPNDRGIATPECYLDTVVGSLPHELQEQVFEVLEVVLNMN
ncbi:uncharacterized protein LOC110976070 isoform X2 [Acanthaster planci]|uniref:Uncharacterized protein LOC110976070 isoform X2 n=1 Tax=Acanthaster planci TaxID=133434 RepID=A0A8B7XV49_ACAPL|nr:uncharacterized protein LOC110976070 isoform X2 [Acanthaster planci]